MEFSQIHTAKNPVIARSFDTIISTRMDEAVIRHAGMLAKRLGT